MPVHDDLGTRMKNYEQRNRYYLQRRMPVIIRLDMRSGHTFTRGFKRPFDEVFIKSMQDTARYLCKNIMGAKLSYQQSDEISLVLVDYEKLNSEAFFDYRVDKLCSITASMATMAFNKYFRENVENLYYNTKVAMTDEEERKWYSLYERKFDKAMFDARCFNIPKEEVTNCIYWRQLDASRNSIQMVGQANFSHKELQHKSCNDIQDMLMLQKGINWNDLEIYKKRGSCCIKKSIEYVDDNLQQIDNELGVTYRNEWVIDNDIPIFKGEGREYIERLINF